MIIAGNGVRIAQARAELCARWRSARRHPVATTASGKGVFPETHPLALGVFGNFGLEAANAVVAEADVVLAVGTKLGPTDTAFENPALLDPERQTIIQIDVEPRHAAWTFPVAQSLVGDAGRAPAARRGRRAPRRWTTAGPCPAPAWRTPTAPRGSFDVPESRSDETPILPQRIIRSSTWRSRTTPIVTCDAGENRLFMMHHFRTKARMEYLQPAAVGGMGYAIPAALAAQAGPPGAAGRGGLRRRRLRHRA